MGLFSNALKEINNSLKELRHQTLIKFSFKAVVNNPKCFHNDFRKEPYYFTEELNQWLENLDKQEEEAYNHYLDNELEDFLYEKQYTVDSSISDECWKNYKDALKELCEVSLELKH